MQQPRVVIDGSRRYYAVDANRAIDRVGSKRTPAEYRELSSNVELDRRAEKDGRVIRFRVVH